MFAALSHQARRHIVMVLAHFGPELPSGYLAKRFTHSWPTTTRHLRVLEEARIVSVRVEGRHSWYRLEREYLTEVVGRWLDLLDATTDPGVWRSPGPRSVTKKGHL